MSLLALPVVGVAELLPLLNTLVLVPSSLMVPVPLAAPELVTVPVMAPVLRVKVSEPSYVVSLVMAVRTSTLVAPAGIVMPEEAETQALPL